VSILIVQTGFLGDIILSTPLIDNLARIYPDQPIDFLVTKQGAAIVSSHPSIRKVIVYDKRAEDRGIRGFFRILKKLRDEKYERVFSLHKSMRTSLLLFLSNIPFRAGFKEAAGFGRLLFTNTTSRSAYTHDVLRNLAILKNIDKAPETCSQKLRIVIPLEKIEDASERLQGFGEKPKLGIAPGSVWMTKRWTPEGFAAVADYFCEQGWSVFLIGGIEDAEIGAKVSSLMKAELTANLIGVLDLIESAAIIANLNLLITNDSAPLHLGSAFKIPTVALFCATVPEFGFGPWDNRAISLGVEGLSCRPCGRHGGNVCPTGTHACQLRLMPDQVIKATLSLTASHS
jgi:heptosyltransferase-2